MSAIKTRLDQNPASAVGFFPTPDIPRSTVQEAIRYILEQTLGDIFALLPADGNFIVGNGVTWVAESGNTARTSLGVGNADDVTFDTLTVTDDAYDASAWNGSALVPTKNALRDKIELMLGTTLPATYQPLDADLTAIAALATAAYGRSLLTLANATALAAEVDSFFLTPAEGNAAYQPLDSDLTAIAAIAPANDDIIQRKAGAWINRTMAQLIADLAALGTTFQPLDELLTEIAALSTDPNADSGLFFDDSASAMGFWTPTNGLEFNNTNLRMTANQRTATIEVVIGTGTATITTGVKGFLEIPFACTITAARLLADQSGAIVVNVWKDTYANFPPTVADKITASAPPTITASGSKSEDTTLTGWTTSIAAGDILAFNVDSVTTHQQVTLSLTVTKT